MGSELRPEYKALGALIFSAIGLMTSGAAAIGILFVWERNAILGAWLAAVVIGAVALGWKSLARSYPRVSRAECA